ncbi:pentatricopeptide repeat-containing protein At4g14170-like [Pistacia vera]|uniref:pentatricopeptide repeat-containing protein At4g14170-like n=1 Tax=Pistacia vera TaxID=55513 RepID=UPI0012630978|nr:pentatricopeptide repeat-containing protein At4g14170-like [Pistacia vera]
MHRTKSNLISYYFSLLHSSPHLSHLRHLHARLLRTSLYNNVILTTKLVLMYSKHHQLHSHSLSLFFHMPHRNIFSWNIILREFSRSNFPHKSLQLFHHMWEQSNVRPDDFTLPLVLRACAILGDLKLGLSVHGLCHKLGFERSLFVASALVFFYVTFGRIFYAREVFDEMPDKDSVLWTAMLAGYAQHAEPILALQVFREMVGSEVELDDVVMVSLLLACTQSGWLKHGKSVHAWCLRRFSLRLGLNLGNAVIDMYVKCSKLCYGNIVFDNMDEKDVISWSSLILGYGLSGSVNIALELFHRMREEGFKPNDVTFLGVLSACAHGGLVEKARLYFKMMEDLDVKADLKHYASMVDCLARAGLLKEAERFIEEMPVEPDAALLGAILGGCRVHNDIVIGERIARKLIRLQPEKAGYYVLLSNMYAAAGRFDEAEKVRIVMKERNVSKVPGCSLIESKNSFVFPTR